MRKTKLAMLQSVVALILCAAMLVGTTFAWFTDSVTSGVNKIQAGNLDVDLVDAAGNSLEGTSLTFMDVTGNTDILWEPGCTFKTQGFRVANRGSLALEYTMYINGLLGDSKLLEAIDFSVQDADGYTVDIDTFEGQLSPKASSDVFYLVGHMDENAGNEYMNLTLTGIGITVYATQAMEESDAFGPEYDKDAFFPGLDAPILGSVNITTENDLLTADAVIVADGAKVTIPAGTRVEPGTTTLKLRVKLLEETSSNVQLGVNEVLQPMDVTVEGISEDNHQPLTVELSEIAPVGLNMGSIALHHVHNGTTVTMTRVAADAAFTADNQYRYDPATGDLALHMATFSEVAVVADTENAWEGDVDHSWYDADATELTIANADQLWSFSQIVGGMNGKTQDSFAGKTVKLIADINLGDKESENNPNIIFYPIGYYNSEGTYERTNTAITSGLRNFEGTFDGNGHTVSNFYQNTWEMKGDHDWYSPEEQYYRDGMGLFGRVYKGTVKNLTIENFSSDGEITTTGCVAAYADGATFENIAIFDCNPRVYNIGNGGIVGCVGWYAKEADLKTTFTNITVDNSNKISALWGSYDVACGGIVGQYYPTSGQSSANYPVNAGLDFVNCHVSAVMDVYNDVCANYQYYAYRYTGMLIGSVRENETIDGHVYPKMDGITAKDCTVHFGDWNDYYYCELVANSLASYTHDHQMSRLEQVASVDVSNKTVTDLAGKTVAIPTSGRVNYVVVKAKDANGMWIHGDGHDYAECYHFVNGVQHFHDVADADNPNPTETVNGVAGVLKEDKQLIYREFNNLVTGYGWGVTSKGVGDLVGVTILDREVGNSVVKFEGKAAELANNKEYKFGDIFTFVNNGVKLVPGALAVSVHNLDENNPVSATIVYDRENWTNGTITLTGTGTVKITIQDYYFCTPTTITVNVTERATEKKFETKFTGDFLYRVGNASGSTVALGTLFNGTNVTNGNVTIAFETVAGNASVAYTANNTTWESGKIQFSGTGVVKVSITDNDYCTPTVLYLEVVDAKNITSVAGSDGTDVVLLNDVKVSANGTANYKNCTVYGNGFTFDVRGGMNQYNSKQGHGIIIINNATLDHLQIVGDVYDEYGMYTTSDMVGTASNDYTGAVDATNSIIQNCYIANCAAPIRANGITLTDSTLYGGTIANLLISGGTNTLTNVTTINHNDGRGVIGMGIVITDGANPDSTKLILNGYLKQHNYVYETDISEIKVEEAKSVFESMFKNEFSAYHIGSNPKAVNTGIISINEGIKLTEEVLTDNANTGYTIKNGTTITISPKGFDTEVQASVASVPGSGSVNNNFVDKGNNQGDYLPTFDFDLGDQMLAKDNDDDTRYLIGDKNGLSAMYPKGETALTLDLTKLATVSKYLGTSYAVTAKCIGPNGKEQTGTVTLDAKGTYTLVFTVEDNIFYDQDGNKIEKSVDRTYEVELVLDLYEKSIADATMTISGSNLTGEYISSGTNKKYKMYPLMAITSIMDDANKDGVLETFDFKKNIQSAVLTPESNNAFSSPTTITITYTGGQVLTIVLGTPSGLNSPGASNGGKTFSAKTDSTNGIYLQSDGAVASSSAATGTWPLTSWSFKGTSGKVITNNTQVTINFTKPSSGCFAEGTLITLADGTKKPIEQVTYEDQLLAWDFNTGAYVATVPSLIESHEAGEYRVINLKFADGTVTRIIVDHGFFCVEENNFVFIDEENVASYVGKNFVKVNGGSYDSVELVGYDVTAETVSYYTIQTAIYNNCIAENMFTLTSPPEMLENDGWFDYFEIGEGMKYDEAKMQADIEKYGLYTYEDFAEYVTYEQFIAFNGPYLKVLVGRGVITFEQIIELIGTYVNN